MSSLKSNLNAIEVIIRCKCNTTEKITLCDHPKKGSAWDRARDLQVQTSGSKCKDCGKTRIASLNF